MKLLVVAALLCINVIVAQYEVVDCPDAPSKPADRRTNKKNLSIATFNAEWLFLTKYSNCPGSGCAWKTLEEAEAHFERVVGVVSAMNADILNIVEVQDCPVLIKLASAVQALNPKANYKPYLLKGTDTATGQNVGLLTRVDPSQNLQRSAEKVHYPVPGSACNYAATGNQGVSKHYYTTFQIKGLDKPLALIGAHLLAFPDRPDRCSQREAQAVVLQNIIKNNVPLDTHHVMLVGDLNDFDPTTPDPAGNVPLSRVLTMLKDPVTEINGFELQNAARKVSKTQNRYSCWYDMQNDCESTTNELSLIDHVLLSNDLEEYVEDVVMYHAYPGNCTNLQSDHWPIMINFHIPQAE